MRALRRISAAIVGSVFFLAAILKLMDPVGSGLVVEEYFKFLHLWFLMPCARVAGIVMAMIEAALGAAMITDCWHKATGIATAVVLGGFTVLTAVLWICNPPMDCGCFGEAIHLTHAQSFWKNIVLLVLWAVAFVPLNVPYKAAKNRYVAFWLAMVSAALFLLYSLLSIPMQDFTSLSPGVEIMQPDDEYAPDAPMLSFCDVNGEYADEMVFGKRLMLVSAYDPGKISESRWKEIASFVGDVRRSGLEPLVLVASTPDEIADFVREPDVLLNLYFADRRMLMTFNRSNGGATYIADGQIVNKWAVRVLPAKDDLEWLARTDSTEALMDSTAKPRMRLQAFLLYVFAVLLLI